MSYVNLTVMIERDVTFTASTRSLTLSPQYCRSELLFSFYTVRLITRVMAGMHPDPESERLGSASVRHATLRGVNI